MLHQSGPHMKVAFGAMNHATNQRYVFVFSDSIFQVLCAPRAVTRRLDGIIQKAALYVWLDIMRILRGNQVAQAAQQAFIRLLLDNQAARDVQLGLTRMQGYLHAPVAWRAYMLLLLDKRAARAVQ